MALRGRLRCLRRQRAARPPHKSPRQRPGLDPTAPPTTRRRLRPGTTSGGWRRETVARSRAPRQGGRGLVEAPADDQRRSGERDEGVGNARATRPVARTSEISREGSRPLTRAAASVPAAASSGSTAVREMNVTPCPARRRSSRTPGDRAPTVRRGPEGAVRPAAARPRSPGGRRHPPHHDQRLGAEIVERDRLPCKAVLRRADEDDLVAEKGS